MPVRFLQAMRWLKGGKGRAMASIEFEQGSLCYYRLLSPLRFAPASARSLPWPLGSDSA
jgi:hypothetical protein